MAKGNKTIRTRNWMILVYPESAPENWRDIISAEQVQWIESPLHDKDVFTELDEKGNPEHKAGQTKKPHYHIMIM